MCIYGLTGSGLCCLVNVCRLGQGSSPIHCPGLAGQSLGTEGIRGAEARVGHMATSLGQSYGLMPETDVGHESDNCFQTLLDCG